MQAIDISDIGKRRKNNEDAVQIDLIKGVFILADGMGGHEAGEVASALAVKAAYSYLAGTVDKANDQEDISRLLLQSLFKAHEAVRQKARIHTHLMGMGTTLVEMFIRDRMACFCHVGDSRAYLLRDGIRQITEDHTVGNYLVKHRFMQRDEIPPRQWQTLTQAVGLPGDLVPELNQVQLETGDLLILCSDGLTDMLSDTELREIVQKYPDDLARTGRTLVNEANLKGGKDNITLVLVGV